MSGKDVQKWADSAMFEAEKLEAADGPRVFLLAAPNDPLGQIAAGSMMYEGKVVRDLSEITDEQRRHYFNEITRTKLKAPFELVDFHFLVEGVTRSFTHQMVRQRTAVYMQESMRFAVKTDMAAATALPPSLVNLPEDDPKRVVWDKAVEDVGEAYLALIDAGVPAEDARGLAPHNVTTRLHYSTDLRALQDHAGNRLCTQAQFEWRLVWVRIIEAIRDYVAQYEVRNPLTGKTEDRDSDWQYALLAGLFRPVCYLTGKCEFKADFDRKCSIRGRVDANHEIGRDSSQWDKDYDHVPPDVIVTEVGPKTIIREEAGSAPVFIGAIHPAEWLLDAGAAR